MKLINLGLTMIFFMGTVPAVFPQQSQNVISNQTLPNRGCGTPALPQQFEQWVQGISAIQNGKPKGGPGNTMSVFNIPVIVHVVHNNEPLNSTSATSGGNLNAAQIYDQINILNRDFNGLNPDTTNIPAVFKPLLGKFQFNFCLAVVNPTGGVLAEPGIDRINRSSKGWSAPPYTSTYARNTIKPQSIWDPTKYLNMWVLNLGSGLLGFATFPDPGTSGVPGLPSPYGNMTNDGLVMRNTAFGSIGTAAVSSPYHLGRTAVHELGHWLGLRHIWGDATCGTDYCADTPPAQASNYGCKSHPYKLGTCSGNITGEMFMNYMDYTNDGCMNMFTQHQKNRAQLIMTHSPIRAGLLTSTVCNLPSTTNDIGILHVHSPTYSQVITCNNALTPYVVLHNFGSNTIASATYSYNLNGVNTQTAAWTGSLLPGSSATIALQTINNLVNGSHQYNVGFYNPNGQTDPYLTNNYNNQYFSITGSFTLAAAAPASVCAGNSISLTASGGATSYSWLPGVITGTVASYTPTSNTTYTLTGSMGTCVNSITVSTSVLPLPVVTINSASICSGSTATLSPAGACAYTWMPGNVTTSQYIVSPSTTTVYSLLAQDCNGCSVTKITTVSVVQQPAVTINVSPAGSLCSGGTATLTASGASAYNWSSGATGSVVVVSPSVSSGYSVTGSNGACQSTAATQVSVGTTSFSISISPAQATVCVGGNIVLNASGASSYTWNGGTNNASVSLSPTVNTTYTVTGTNGVCTASAATTVSLVNKPVISVSYIPASSVCAGNSLQVIASGAGNYTWSTGDTGSSINLSPTGTAVYSVTGGSTGCTSTETAVVSLGGSTLGLAISATPPTVCAGGTTTLTAHGIPNYTWTGATVPGSFTFAPTATTIYTLTGSDGPCAALATLEVTVVPPPVFTLQANPPLICAGESATLSASGPYTVFQWLPGPSVGTDFLASPPATKQYTVVAGGAQGGCTASGLITLTVVAAPVAVLSITNSPCDEHCQGVVSATVTGGAAPYVFGLFGSACDNNRCENVCPGLYTGITTDANGCTATNYFSIECYIKTSLEKTVQSVSVSIYPNPAREEITLQANGEFSYSVHNELGQTIAVKTACQEEETVPLTGYASGMYMIKIVLGTEVIIKKFIRE